MLISRSCSWCEEMIPATARSCPGCGHDAGPRMLCRCARRRAEAADAPVPLGGVIAAALAALRRDDLDLSPQPEEDAMTRKHHAAATPDPAAREWERTPVPAELAEMVRVLDDALLAAYGFDLCYVVMARGGIIAASSATHGYLPPIIAPAPPEAGG